MADDSYQLKARSPNAKLALELARDGIDKQLSFVDAIDSKLATIVGFASAIVTIFGGLLAISRRGVPDGSIWLLLSAGGVYVSLMVIAIWALWPRDWLYTPLLHDIDARANRGSREDGEDLAWAANEYDKMFYANASHSESKARLLCYALVLLALEAALLIACSAVFLLAADDPAIFS